MRQLNLDGYADAVKDFVRQLAAEADGAALTLEGHTVVYVVPAPSEGETDDGPWTEAKNARRCELIDKDIAGTLLADEVAELRRLEQAARREAQRLAPLPLADARALLNELLAKAQARKGA